MREEHRSTARLLTIDPAGRVLLLLHQDRLGREFWATPGGGIEAGESAEEAARREALEELEISQVELREIWTGRSEFVFDDRQVYQKETFFFVLSYSGAMSRHIGERHRAEGIKEFRWWSLDELATADFPIYPIDLSAKLREKVPGVA